MRHTLEKNEDALLTVENNCVYIRFSQTEITTILVQQRMSGRDSIGEAPDVLYPHLRKRGLGRCESGLRSSSLRARIPLPKPPICCRKMGKVAAVSSTW